MSLRRSEQEQMSGENLKPFSIKHLWCVGGE